jgi:hypothetical protein
MMDDGLADQRAEMGHPIRKPLRDTIAVQRKIGRSGFVGHQLNCPGGIPRQSPAELEVPVLFPPICAHASTASSVSRRCHRVSGSDKPQTDGFEALLTVGYVDGDALPFHQAHDAGALQRRGMHENVLAALIRSDKAEALVGVVPLHRA